MTTARRPRVICAATLALAVTFFTLAAPQSPGLAAPAPEAFYDPPAKVPYRPGSLLRQAPLPQAAAPSGMRGWRILYTTTVNDRTPAIAAATVFAPIAAPPGPRPVIAWTHDASGLLQKCMPSWASRPAAGVPALATAAQQGWVIVATDYAFAERGGPHPYGVGQGEARAALDAVRAARAMPQLKLSPRTVVWGHGQGGHAALWTGIVAPRYAPEVEVVGVAAIAPAADMAAVFAMNPAVERRRGPYVAGAYSRFYPDVRFEQAIRPPALAAARTIARLCGSPSPNDAELASAFDGPALASATNEVLRFRLAENAANRPIDPPLLIVQGLADQVTPPKATDGYVAARCAAGQRLEYWRLAGLDHAGIVQPGAPLEAPLAAWTAARLDGEPAPASCTRREIAR